MYSLRAYGEMISDGGRFNAYANAIARAVRPGHVVLEIGCGPGVFSLLACRAEAARVYAIEAEDVVQLASQLASANGLEARIKFLQSDSRRTELPERADVIVSDIRGTLPLFGHAVSSLEDARLRFLAPGGVLIPQRDTLKAALAEVDVYYSSLTSPWSRSLRGLDLSSSLSLILNQSHGVSFKKEQLLTEPQSWCVLDYTARIPKQSAANLNFRALRPGVAHGICVWFETQLFEDIGYSSGPDGASTIYGQLFLPWLEAVKVTEGQEIHVELHADLVGADYVWRWEATIKSGREAARHFRQSTFQGENFAAHFLHRRAADFVPTLSEAGEAERWFLQSMDGTLSLQEIAEQAAKRFPRVFSVWDEAFRRVSELSGKYSR